MPDPVKDLLRAAAVAARHIGCRERAARVVVYCAEGLKVIDLHVPHEALHQGDDSPRQSAASEVVPGWRFTDRAAFFDGRPVAVSPSRVRLLRLLAEADGPLLAREIRDRVYDAQTTEGNVRYHIEMLRDELAAAFPRFEGDLVTNDGGYRLEMRG
jgi:DNA-binding response OmpR family regulator